MPKFKAQEMELLEYKCPKCETIHYSNCIHSTKCPKCKFNCTQRKKKCPECLGFHYGSLNSKHCKPCSYKLRSVNARGKKTSGGSKFNIPSKLYELPDGVKQHVIALWHVNRKLAEEIRDKATNKAEADKIYNEFIRDQVRSRSWGVVHYE